MSDALVETLSDALVKAHHDPAQPIAATALVGLDAETAMAVQGAVLRKLNASVSVAKVAAPAGGRPLAAPIMDSWVAKSGETLTLNGRNMIGLEIEIAAVLKADITAELVAQGRDAVAAAIDHYIVGIELIGSRIDDRLAAGPFGPLADSMITSGYVLGTQRLDTLPAVDGLGLRLTTGEGTSEVGPANYPFGGVLEPIMAYVANGFDQFGGLRAGMTVTTGSLTPLIASPTSGPITLQLGDFAPVTVVLG
jgi:2-keto-4-pentenoate hydratase